MLQFTGRELVEVLTEGELLQGNPNQCLNGVSTDTRQIVPGQLFIPLKGEHFDGHDFLEGAVTAGAGALLISKDQIPDVSSKVVLIKVPDTLRALGEIALAQRLRFPIPVVGITGSNGKTTTKDLLGAILATEKKILKTYGNYNNEIGLPLTLFQLSPETEVAILEMGMRGNGQIKALAEMARPDIGVITNVGLTHLELLGSIENIAKAKRELIESLPQKGMAVLNGDDPLVRKMAENSSCQASFYGIESAALDYQAVAINMLQQDSVFIVKGVDDLEMEIFLPLPGKHNIYNALAAIATAKFLGISNENIQRGLANVELTGKRLTIHRLADYTIIDDTYNASPASLKAAINVLTDMGHQGRKIAVLADMLELGADSERLHYECGRYIAAKEIDLLFVYGRFGADLVKGFNMTSEKNQGYLFNEKTDLMRNLKLILKAGDVLLVKGSRGMKMEEVVESLFDKGVEN